MAGKIVSMVDNAGYSGTPLAKKLGIKAGHRIRVEGAPANYREMLSTLPDDVVISSRLSGNIDIWHVFAARRAALARRLPAIESALADQAMLWISWYKKSSGHATDITEDTLRELALPLQLVDIKVCAIDADWSALKFVRRVASRG